jgi:hypothetical protein
VTSDLIDIHAVEVLHDRVVRLTFETGEIRDLDLAPMLWGPAFETLADDLEFNRVAVDRDSGTISWPNGADLSSYTLYRLSVPAGTPSTSA